MPVKAVLKERGFMDYGLEGEKIISWDMKKNILGGAVQIFFVGEMTAKLMDENGEIYLIHMDTLEMTKITK